MAQKNITESQFKEAVFKSNSIAEALRHLGLRKSSSSYRVFNRRVEKWNIDIGHFETHSERTRKMWLSNRFTQSIPLGDILVENSTYQNPGGLKKKLYKQGFKLPICEECGQNDEWLGKKLTLQLDHINGVRDDNRLENLRILCPNCHSVTDTWCGRSKSMLKLNRENKPKNPSPRKTKIDWPPTLDLIQMVKDKSFLAVGKELGVSDNAVRKRIRYH